MLPVNSRELLSFFHLNDSITIGRFEKATICKWMPSKKAWIEVRALVLLRIAEDNSLQFD